MSAATIVRAVLLAGSVACAPLLAKASTASVDFDEFASPPVSCCYASSGVTGPVSYATVLVDGGASAAVMNGEGWLQAQTSGANLYGTLEGSISLVFHQASSALSLDVINGTDASDYTVALYDIHGALLDTGTQSLAGFDNVAGTTGVAHFSFADLGVYSAVISGSGDFAIDTVGFDTGLPPPVPEPSSGLLTLAAVAFVVVAARRRAAVRP
jgi:hypothetical protein